MGSIERRKQRKASMKWKLERQKPPNLNNKGKKRLEKEMKKASKISETITKDLNSVLLQSQKERRRRVKKKNIEEKKRLENSPNWQET